MAERGRGSSPPEERDRPSLKAKALEVLRESVGMRVHPKLETDEVDNLQNPNQLQLPVFTSPSGRHRIVSIYKVEESQRVLGWVLPITFTIGSAMFLYLAIAATAADASADNIVYIIASSLFTIGSAAMFLIVDKTE